MRSFLVPARSYEPELMDHPGHSEEEMAAVMRDLERVNRRLGGVRSLWRPLEAMLRATPRTELTILDVGTGGGDVPRAIQDRARTSGIRTRAIGIDIDPASLAWARRAGVDRAAELAFVRADAFRLPFRDGAFDVVTSCMMFHHFREADAATLLAEMARVSRGCVLVNDLARHRIPLAVIGLLSRFSESRMVRHDAPLSVRRGWTADELLALAGRAGLGAGARVLRLFPYRLVLVVERAAPRAA